MGGISPGGGKRETLWGRLEKRLWITLNSHPGGGLKTFKDVAPNLIGMPKSKGFRYKSRRILTLPRGARRSPLPEIYLREYKPGDRVTIKINPSVQKGAPHRRYHGKIGEILEKRGRAYVVAVKLGEKLKKLTVLPDHIAKWGE